MLAAAAHAEPQSFLAAGISTVDVRTSVDGLSQLAHDAGAVFVDITPSVRQGGGFSGAYDLLVLGSFFTDDPLLGPHLLQRAQELHEWIAHGGVVVSFTQNLDREEWVDWLPDGMLAHRTNSHHGVTPTLKSDHPLWANLDSGGRPITSNWHSFGALPVWNVFDHHPGMSILAALSQDGRSPVVLEGAHRQGRILLLAVAPDKAYATPDTPEHARQASLALMRSIIAYARLVRSENVRSVMEDQQWVSPQLPVHGGVFHDLDADGVRDEGEDGIEGVWVSSGLHTVATDPQGSFELGVDVSSNPFVWCSTPSGWRPSTEAWRRIEESDDVECWIGIAPWPEGPQPGEAITLVQVTDHHVYTFVDGRKLLSDVKELSRLDPLSGPPVFVIDTGDLVQDANYPESLAYYAEAVAQYGLPHFPVIGNHDVSRLPNPRARYQDLFGPTFFSWNVGGFHFVVCDYTDWGYEQLAWLADDLDTVPLSVPTVVFTHSPTPGQLRILDDYPQARAVVSGHWHATRVRKIRGYLEMIAPRMVSTGVDGSARGFRVLTLRESGIEVEDRFSGVSGWLRAAGCADGEGVLPISDLLVSTYDTATPVQKVTARIDQGNEIPLEQVTDWLWKAPGDLLRRVVPRRVDGYPNEVHLESAGRCGQTWSSDVLVSLDATPRAPYRAGPGWHQFQGGPERRGFRQEGPLPPLHPAWVVWPGGTSRFAAPVIAEGLAWVASDIWRTLDDCAVVGLSMGDGSLEVRFPTEAAVNNSPAWSDGRLVAVDVNGKVYAWDTYQRSPVWTRQLGNPNDRWEQSTPLIVEGRVWVGNSSAFHCLAVETGQVLWAASQPGGDWLPRQYPAPTLIPADFRVLHAGKQGLFMFDASSGILQWARTSQASLSTMATPFACDGTALYGIMGYKAIAISPADGAELWRVPDIGGVMCMPALGGDVVCAGTGGGEILGLERTTGRLLWRTPSDPGIISPPCSDARAGPGISVPPVIIQDTAYSATNSGTLRALDLHTGKVIWRFDLGIPIQAGMAADGNSLIALPVDGSVWCFRERSPLDPPVITSLKAMEGNLILTASPAGYSLSLVESVVTPVLQTTTDGVHWIEVESLYHSEAGQMVFIFPRPSADETSTLYRLELVPGSP